MSIKFEVKMTDKYMYDFMLYHNYTNFSGLFGAIVGVIGLGAAIMQFAKGNSQGAMFGLLIAVWFLGVTPFQMRSKSKMQVKGTEMFQKPLEYEFTETGIVVRQDGLEATNAWEEFQKAVSTNRSIIIYVTRVRALILPKECMGEHYEDAVKMIHTHMSPAKVKIKHIH